MESYFARVPVPITELAWCTQKHTDTQSLQLSSVISMVTCLKVK